MNEYDWDDDEEKDSKFPHTTHTARASLSEDMLCKMQSEVYEAIASFGERGAIMDDVARLLEPRWSHSGVTMRFSELEKRGFIERKGDTRMGARGRPQLVMRALPCKKKEEL